MPRKLLRIQCPQRAMSVNTDVVEIELVVHAVSFARAYPAGAHKRLCS